MRSTLINLGDVFVSLPGIRKPFLALTRNRVPIFLLHRAMSPDFNIQGYQIERLMAFIDRLEASGVAVVSLAEIVAMAAEGREPAGPVVVFTADDGYADQASILGNAFASRSTPLTIFLITDFVDGASWPWDAKIAHLFYSTRARSASVRIGNLELPFDLSTAEKKLRSRREFQLLCKSLSPQAVSSAIKALARSLAVDVPTVPPRQYRPMTWDDARRLESQGITFAPHSCSHRVLSRLPEADVERELASSWNKVSSELVAPLKIIAWPIGRSEDFGAKEIRIARALDYRGAVAAQDNYTIVGRGSDPFELDRFGISTHDEGRSSFRSVTGIRRTSRARKGRVRVPERSTDVSALGGMPVAPEGRVHRRTRVKSTLATAGGLLGRYRKPSGDQMRSTKRLVFVCKGNICRSPYAEAIATQLGVDAISCGLEANNTAHANEVAARVAYGRGVDLSMHQSRNIDQVEIYEGDLLLAMEPSHMSAIERFALEQRAVTSLLGLWASPRRPWIVDPYGLSPDVFDRSFRQIDNALSSLLRELARLQS